MAEAELVNVAQVLVKAHGVVKRYGAKLAVDAVNFEVHAGEIYGLIGPDGAGKSSLLKAIAGVLSFEQGSLEVFDILLDSERACERVKNRIGLMPQRLGQNLYGDLSVEENIDYFAGLRGIGGAELVTRKETLLHSLRLEGFRERAMKNLSGGMKQKLGLACTLIHEPSLLILDEPTTGIDPVSRREFWIFLNQLLKEKKITAIVATAYVNEASQFHRLALMHNGRIIASGKPDQIKAMAGAALDAELEDVFIALLSQQEPAQPGKLPVISNSPVARATGSVSHELAIEADHLTRLFGKFKAADQVSFQVSQGEIFGLLGANGAGKSTVIKMLIGILSPNEGRGRVAGVDMHDAGKLIRERIGYVSQAFSLYLDLTVKENIDLYAGIYGIKPNQKRERVDSTLDFAGLRPFANNLCAGLPIGLRQRLALGCALIHRPQVLFLDEPTSGVDPLGRRDFWKTLFHLSREENVTILITTHYMSEAERCDHIALMHAGRVVADASPNELKTGVENELGKLFELQAERPQPVLDALHEIGFSSASLFGPNIQLFARAPAQDLQRIHSELAARGLMLNCVTPRNLSMEEAFVHIITKLERQS